MPSNDFSIILVRSIEKILPSSATLLPESMLTSIQVMKSFFSAIEDLIRTNPESYNWFSAWIKYLESVHKPANVSVTTTVAAEPMKPVSQAIMRQ